MAEETVVVVAGCRHSFSVLLLFLGWVTAAVYHLTLFPDCRNQN